MKAVLIVVVALCGLCVASEDFCYDGVNRACKTTSKLSTSGINCTAKYGAIDQLQEHLQKYINHHFIRSFEYLLMSTHYANYEKNRPGFEKLFRDLSDDTWKEAIELIQYVTKRGGEMNFGLVSPEVEMEALTEPNFELYELQSIAKALDIEKKLAVEAFKIHRAAARSQENHHDPELSSHMEHEFMPKQRDIIRKLAGYTTDLSTLLDGPDSSLSLYLFDEYLQKQ